MPRYGMRSKTTDVASKSRLGTLPSRTGAATVGGALTCQPIAGLVTQSTILVIIPSFMVVILIEGAFRVRADHPDHRASL